MCKWSGEEENWDSKSNDPNDFPYAPQLSPVTSENDKKSKQKSKGKKGKLIESGTDAVEYPEVVTIRICLPFEFRFANQEVQLEIRDTTDNNLLYEIQIPFEQLLNEP